MDDTQLAAIKGYAQQLNSTIDDDDLLTLVVEIVVDRVLLYLNAEVLADKLERIVAQVVVGVFIQTRNNSMAVDVDRAITQVEDNGQVVTYANQVQNYLATADDGALFGGFAGLLARYRRVNVNVRPE